MRTYAASICSVVVAWALRTLLDPWLADEAPFILSVPPVVFSAWYGGLGPGLVALALGGALGAWVLVYHAPWHSDPVGNVLSLALYVVATLLVVLLAESQRRAHQRARQEAAARLVGEGRWAVTLRSIADGVVTTDLCERVTFMNPTAEALTGCSATDSVGRPCGEVVAAVVEATGAPAPSPLSQAMRDNAVVKPRVQTLLARRDGSRIAVDSSGAPIRDDQGSVVGGVLVLRDITERKEHEARMYRWSRELERRVAERTAELQTALTDKNAALAGEHRALEDLRETTAALTESEANYHLLFDVCPQPVFVIDSETLAFLAANNAGVATFGYTREEILAANVRHLRADPADDTLFRHVRGLDSAKTFTVTSRYRRRDGVLLDMEITGQALRYAGRPAWLVVASDVTQRHRAEQALLRSFEQARRLAQHLQSVREEERTEVAREVHDELGQSLTGLKMDAAWILGRLRHGEDRAGLEAVADRIEAMSELIDGTIGTVRRIATALRPAVLDTLGLVAAIEWQTRDFEKRTQIHCEFTANTDETSVGRECSTALFRILQESLTNVLRHAQATCVRVELACQANSLRLTVRDNGVGIPEERATATGSLGLLGMRERALAFDGHVEITGRPGEGTCVSVVVPCPCTRATCAARRPPS